MQTPIRAVDQHCPRAEAGRLRRELGSAIPHRCDCFELRAGPASDDRFGDGMITRIASAVRMHRHVGTRQLARDRGRAVESSIRSAWEAVPLAPTTQRGSPAADAADSQPRLSSRRPPPQRLDRAPQRAAWRLRQPIGRLEFDTAPPRPVGRSRPAVPPLQNHPRQNLERGTPDPTPAGKGRIPLASGPKI